MKIKITVVYPVTFETEIKEEELKDIPSLRERIKNEADEIYEASSIQSLVHDCDEIPELVE